MYDPNPLSTINNYRIHRREHLLCAAILTVAVGLLTALLALILSHPFISRSATFSFAMDTFAYGSLLFMIAGSVFRIALDLWQALLHTRVIQSQSWAVLSLQQG